MATIRPNAEPAATSVQAGDIFLIDGATGVRALAASALLGYTTTATAAGTTTLTAASTKQQFFTGTTTQTVLLPVTSTLALGQGFLFDNDSTGAVTVQSSGANNVLILAPGTRAFVECIAITGTTAASWDAAYLGDVVASGKVLTVSNSLTLAGTDGKTLTVSNSLTLAGTDGTTQTFQASDTIVGRATTDTLTNKTFDTAGAGNVFKINGIAIAANTGTGSNVLATTPTISQANLVGTTTNDSAAAGSIGEIIQSSVAVGSAVGLTSPNAANMTNISLTAGDWEVFLSVAFNIAGTTTITNLIANISQTSATLDSVTPGAQVVQRFASFTPGGAMNVTVGPIRISLASTTPIYGVAQSTFGTSTNAVYGLLKARRVR